MSRHDTDHGRLSVEAIKYCILDIHFYFGKGVDSKNISGSIHTRERHSQLTQTS